MIQIDDAGSGSLIGGTVIGIYRVETKEYVYDIIPLQYYEKKNIESKAYLQYVVRIVQKLFSTLHVSQNERIEVCRGYMFDELRKWLSQEKYLWKNTVIEGTLQEAVEKSFETYAMSLGFPESFIKYTRYPFHFHRILKWVYADYKNRIQLCKIGWKSFEKYGCLPIEERADIYLSSKNLHCLKCGKPFNSGDPIRIITFYSNHKNDVLIHEKCSSKKSCFAAL